MIAWSSRRAFFPVIAGAIVLSAGFSAIAETPTVKVEPFSLQGPRELNEQTRAAVLRDYVESWQSLAGAFESNRPALLDRDFVGTAREKLGGTIREQTAAGLTTRYVDHAHDVQIVFYSPEGLSVELIDTVDYDVEVRDQGKLIGSEPVHGRYTVVMTPSEVRWRVRVFQADTGAQ